MWGEIKKFLDEEKLGEFGTNRPSLNMAKIISLNRKYVLYKEILDGTLEGNEQGKK